MSGLFSCFVVLLVITTYSGTLRISCSAALWWFVRRDAYPHKKRWLEHFTKEMDRFENQSELRPAYQNCPIFQQNDVVRGT